MKANSVLLLDIIYKKKNDTEKFINELDGSIDVMDQEKKYLYEYDLEKRRKSLDILNELISRVKENPNSSVEILKKYLKEIKEEKEKSFVTIKISKAKIVKELIKEYKTEYRKNYWNNRYLGTVGLFDNELFCNIIKSKIDKYVYCNKVTKTKYKHYVAFLNEFLHEMESSEDPLNTLKHKMKLYQKYKKKEYVEIRKNQNPKIDIIKEILEEYKKEKNETIRCK